MEIHPGAPSVLETRWIFPEPGGHAVELRTHYALTISQRVQGDIETHLRGFITALSLSLGPSCLA